LGSGFGGVNDPASSKAMGILYGSNLQPIDLPASVFNKNGVNRIWQKKSGGSTALVPKGGICGENANPGEQKQPLRKKRSKPKHQQIQFRGLKKNVSQTRGMGLDGRWGLELTV